MVFGYITTDAQSGVAVFRQSMIEEKFAKPHFLVLFIMDPNGLLGSFPCLNK